MLRHIVIRSLLASSGATDLFRFEAILCCVNIRERAHERDQVCVVSGVDAQPWYYGQNACHIIRRSHFQFVRLCL